MDKKMFDITDFYNRPIKRPPMSDSMVENCFDTGFCNDAPNDDTNGVLTMAFVNMQPLDYVYNESDAFLNGTLFPNINKPFYGGNLK